MIYVCFGLVLVGIFCLASHRREWKGSLPTSLRQLAQEARNPKFAWCKPRFGVDRLYRKAMRALAKKRKRGGELLAFEEWLWDHDHLFLSAIHKAKGSTLYRLPAVGGIPRVLALARFAVAHCAHTSLESVRALCMEYQSVTPLSWPELQALPAALLWATVEANRTVLEGVLHIEKVRRVAELAHVPSLLSDDVYVYYRYLAGGIGTHNGLVAKASEQFFLTQVEYEQQLKNTTVAFELCLRTLTVEVLQGFSCSLNLLATDKPEEIATSTKTQCLHALSHLSTRLNRSEAEVAEAVNHVAGQLGVDVANVLDEPRSVRGFLRNGRVRQYSTKGRQVGYILLVAVLAGLLASVPLVFVRSVVTYLALPMLWVANVPWVEWLVQRMIKPRGRIVCRMNYHEISAENTTLVVLCHYVDNTATFSRALLHALSLLHNGPRENVQPVLLVDFPSKSAPWSEEDDALLSEIRAMMKPHPEIVLAVRKRVEDGKRYVAWERKRGAILQLFEYLLKGDGQAFAYIGEVNKNAKFAVLLDDDSELLPQGILDAVNTMIHPANRACDMMTFTPRTRLKASKTLYSKRFVGEGVSVGYPMDGGYYAAAFGTGVHMGKGIVRIRPYYEKLQGLFPDRRILSHDLIEGSMLSTQSLGLSVFEDVPQGLYQDATRTARWTRGDVLLWPYVGRTFRAKDGKRRLNQMQPIYRYLLVANATRPLLPLLLLSSLFLATVSGTAMLLWYLLGWIGLPFFIHVGSVLLSLQRKRLRYVAERIARSILRVVDYLVLLPFWAVEGLCSVLSTMVVGMVGRKNMLVWQPFSLTKGGSVFACAKRMAPAVLLMTALGVLSMDPWFALFAGVGVLASLLYCRDFAQKKVRLATKYREQAVAMLRDSHQFFRHNTHDGLVVDHVQLEPACTGEPMTSPTDLGFSLLASVCLMTVEGESEREWQRLETCLVATSKLERWQGHLYNWYALDGRVLERVVSTVDSANFIFCVRCVRAYAVKCNRKKIVYLCDKFLGADFARLIDREKGLLCITVNTISLEMQGAYDTLMSEARLAYYLAIAQGMRVESYAKLSREFSSLLGNTVLSWGGTAFEYLMPSLFLRSPKGSLLWQSERNAAIYQRKYKVDGCFGVSEGAYYAFNEQMRYRYRAHGLGALALCVPSARRPIAPYASALMLPYLPNEVMENLLRLKLAHAYGKHGFYEAVENGHVLKLHMAHHQGMLMAALTNVLTEDGLVRLLEEDATLSSVRLLLEEGRVEEKAGKPIPRHAAPELSLHKHYVFNPATSVAGHVLEGAHCGLIALSDGRQSAYFGDVLFGRENMRMWARPARSVLIRTQREGVFSPYWGCMRDGDEYAFGVEGDCVRYANDTHNVRENIRVLPDGHGLLHDLCIENTSNETVSYEVLVYEPLTLATKDEQRSHPAFNDLFVHTEIGEKHVYAYRRTDRKIREVLFAVEGLSEVAINTNRRNIPGRGGELNESCFERIHGCDDVRSGDVLYPCVAFSGHVSVPKGEAVHVYFFQTAVWEGVENTLLHWREFYGGRLGDYLTLSTKSRHTVYFEKYASENYPLRVASVLLNHYNPEEARRWKGERDVWNVKAAGSTQE
ncbi:MAG: hypothetical protein IJX70_05370, partial [Clostridia bacterium]|nr:hypothetical protein [Clostridia bacterium]